MIDKIFVDLLYYFIIRIKVYFNVGMGCHATGMYMLYVICKQSKKKNYQIGHSEQKTN